MEATGPFLRFARLCRSVAVGLLANVWPGENQASLEARLCRQSTPVQVSIVGGLLVLLFLAAVLAAQFGWIGLFVFLVAVILLVG
ncbi:MAG: hypothetical protein AAGF30_16520 [Pseudomonadota bacterium]